MFVHPNKERKESNASQLLNEIKDEKLSAETLDSFTNLPALALIAYQVFTQPRLDVVKEKLAHSRGAWVKEPRDKLSELIQESRVFYKLASGEPSKDDDSADNLLKELLKLKNALLLQNLKPENIKNISSSKREGNLQFGVSLSVAVSKMDAARLLLLERIYELASNKTLSESVTEFFSGTMPAPLQRIIVEYGDDEIIQLMNLNLAALENVNDITLLALVLNAQNLRLASPRIVNLLHEERQTDLTKDFEKQKFGLRAPPEADHRPIGSPGSDLFTRVYEMGRILRRIEMGDAKQDDYKVLGELRENFVKPEERQLLEKYGLTGMGGLSSLRALSASSFNERFGQDKDALLLFARLGMAGAITLVGNQPNKEDVFYRALIDKMLVLSNAPLKEQKLKP